MDEIRAWARNYRREVDGLTKWRRRLACWCLGYKAIFYLGGLIGAVDSVQDAPTGVCICGGEPHASACPANRDPFLRGML